MKKFPWACVALTALSLYSSSLLAANFSASFKNTDIREFIDTVSRNLNKTILVDPSVQGTVSVRTYNVLSEEEYYQFFLSVLDLYGLSVIPMDNGMVKVVRSSVARTAGVPVADSKNPGKGDEIITRVVRMENVPVRELAPLLRQLNDASGIGNVVHFEPSNVLLLTGKASVVNRLVDLVERVDRSGMQRREIVPLRYASAKELSDMLNNLNNEEQKGQNAPQLATKVVADDETNSLVISGTEDARARTRSLIGQLDREQNNEGNTRVFYLKYANASKVVPVLTGIGEQLKDKAGTPKSKSASTSSSDLNITADESTNSLVITAQPNVMNSLEKVIDKLDIRRPQVLVEAIIAEVQDGNGMDLGVQWTGKHGGVQFGSTGLPISQIKNGTIKGASFTGLATGFFNGDYGALLTALSTSGKNDILSTPSVVTLDNKEASFNVGQDVPVLSGSQTTSGDNVFNSVERKTVGTKLKIVPQINDGDMIHLKIEQEVSSVDASATEDASLGPTFNTRTINNEVMVHSGQTVVLGGLMENVNKQNVSKVPLLGDLPLVGQLFRYTSQDNSKRNLMVFIHTTVLRDDDNYSAATKEKYDQIRARQQQRMEEQKLGILENSDSPVLPAFPAKSHATPVGVTAPSASRNPFKE
ncbi:type II secretion system secretin GspD [Enterobacter mori]|uniref:type II secretion system secretin GspD n=1 Tax=Enterobacter mori TaxID=539813 RepID=UPI0005B26E94|nr:type II secretion system secretin GspD [Enterobacter mori]BBT89811.1 type II secretion system protein GspD [Enterobacter cloacae]EKS6727275.1 type II secretion system secretin GspD [Enterobacter mori]MBT1869288.1 type II secretion system secretin GspD [Enterobacter mori]MEA5206204.1 type II secretion system secretin GspD [Enterobacter mori]PJD12792.1 type II secretion system protein GspD [Enterobacter mori]